MDLKQQLHEQGVQLRQFEYDDSLEFVADFGKGTTADVDVVDGTVIVVTDEDQYELAVEEDAQAFMKQGILTIEVEK